MKLLVVMLPVLLLSAFVASQGVDSIDAKREALWTNFKQKCSALHGTEQAKCIAMLRSDVFERGNGNGLNGNGLTLTDSQRKKKEAFEQGFVFQLSADAKEKALLGRACSEMFSTQYVETTDMSTRLLEHADVIREHVLTPVQAEQIGDESKMVMELGGESLLVNKATLLPALLPLLGEEAGLYKRCKELVSKEGQRRESQFKQAKADFVEKWRALRVAQNKGPALERAMQALCDARVKAARKLAARGADIERVKVFTSYMEGRCADAASAESFDERKEIMTELNSKWRDFVRDISHGLVLERLEVQVSKLKSIIHRSQEALIGLQEAGADEAQVEFARELASEATQATDAVLEKASLKQMVKKLLVAKSKVRRLVHVINKVQNNLDPTTVVEEEVSDEEVENVPEVVVDPEEGSSA